MGLAQPLEASAGYQAVLGDQRAAAPTAPSKVGARGSRGKRKACTGKAAKLPGIVTIGLDYLSFNHHASCRHGGHAGHAHFPAPRVCEWALGGA